MSGNSDRVFRDLSGLRQTLCRFFDEAEPPSDVPCGPAGRWSPAVDIYEVETAFVLLAEVPGVREEDIGLEITDDLLYLRGGRRTVTEGSSLGYHCLERASGPFERAFRLPSQVDGSAVSASCRDGVLRVNLPKRQEAASCAIDVSVED